MTLQDYTRTLPVPQRAFFITTVSKAIGKAESTVRAYINGQRRVMAEDAEMISRLTGSEVLKSTLCPKVFNPDA